MSSPAGRVYIVDDDESLRDGVTQWLSSAGYEAQPFSSGEEFLEARPTLLPGCIVADVVMPNMSGLDLQQRLLEVGCRWPLIILTGHAGRPAVIRAVESGVISFLEKPVRDIELLAAVMKGHAYLCGNAEMTPDLDLVHRLTRLTRRERQVLDFILQQKLNKQVGAILGIRETTVKGYRRSLMKKLGAHNITELVVMSVRAGLYNPPKS